ncbi:MAG: aminodeoxychorismate synthase component I, partial [Gemmatimonadota bacterium]
MTGVRAILDFPGPAGTDTRLVFTAPTDVLETGELSQVRPLLRRVDQAVRAGCHAVGFVAYEAAPAFDPAMVTRAPNGATPLVWFALFGAPTAAAPPPCTGAAPPAVAWSPDSPRADYDAAISRIRDAIAAGDVYQVNHTLRFTAADVAAASWYDARVAARQGLYHALIETPDWSIACASPELFLDAAGRRITARPMKGTVRRGRWTGEDAAAAAALAGSAKDRAENLMIVDLLRNDLGRIAEFGSVAVPRMYDVETYPTVHQLTSTVTARLRHGIGVDDIFAATFPCGSVTGAPKIAAMRAIAALERAPRGPYCGAIGIMRPDGSFTFNVGIRTLLVDHLARTSVYGAGGGITWDSNAAAEYDEVLAKAALLDEHTPCFDLLETLRLDDGVYSRLPRHLARLADSARYWGFSDDTASNVAAALERERRAAGVGAWRVRVTAGGKGEVEVTRTGGEGWEGAPDCAA